jgi:hypothetical protein
LIIACFDEESKRVGVDQAVGDDEWEREAIGRWDVIIVTYLNSIRTMIYEKLSDNMCVIIA